MSKYKAKLVRTSEEWSNHQKVVDEQRAEPVKARLKRHSQAVKAAKTTQAYEHTMKMMVKFYERSGAEGYINEKA